MFQSRTVLTVALVVVVLSAGCLGDGAPSEPSSDDAEAVPAGSGQQGHVVVYQATDPPRHAVHYSNETIQSTAPIRTALERYRHGESGTVVAVEGDRYDESRSALRELVERSAPTRTEQPGPNTYVELEDATIYVGLTANGSV